MPDQDWNITPTYPEPLHWRIAFLLCVLAVVVAMWGGWSIDQDIDRNRIEMARE